MPEDTAEKASETTSGSREPAPGDLALVQSFINTRELHNRGQEVNDEISTPAELERWLLEKNLLKRKRGLSEADVAHAASVREALRELLAANDGEKVAGGAVATLSRAARGAQLFVAFESDGQAKLAPAASGVDAALGEILAITYRSIVDGSWQRLKACRSETCLWAFYDRSKNRSSSWCSMKVCGNRAKARKFREHKHFRHAQRG